MFPLSRIKYLMTSINSFNPVISSSLVTNCNSIRNARIKVAVKCSPASFFHTTKPTHDLMEFFDVKENWDATEVKVGRSWKKEELRIKSNADLHKLWYVLLKERNMLLTMEHEAKEKFVLFPSPERLDKVAESMENLECVVRERNKAYFELETGESGEKLATFDIDTLGLRPFPELAGQKISKTIDKDWHFRLMTLFKGHAVQKFKKLYQEKLASETRRERNRNRKEVIQLLKRFPHLDKNTLETLYPDVDIEEAMSNKRTLGNHPYNKA